MHKYKFKRMTFSEFFTLSFTIIGPSHFSIQKFCIIKSRSEIHYQQQQLWKIFALNNKTTYEQAFFLNIYISLAVNNFQFSKVSSTIFF